MSNKPIGMTSGSQTKVIRMTSSAPQAAPTPEPAAGPRVIRANTAQDSGTRVYNDALGRFSWTLFGGPQRYAVFSIKFPISWQQFLQSPGFVANAELVSVTTQPNGSIRVSELTRTVEQNRHTLGRHQEVFDPVGDIITEFNLFMNPPRIKVRNRVDRNVRVVNPVPTYGDSISASLRACTTAELPKPVELQKVCTPDNQSVTMSDRIALLASSINSKYGHNRKV